MINLKTLKGFIKKEFRQSLRDPVMLRLIFLAPILELILFGFALNNETINIRFRTFSKPNDIVIKKFEEKAIASTWFIKAIGNENDPFKSIQSGDSEVAIVVQHKKIQDATLAEPVSVQVLISAINSIRAQAIESYVQAILQEAIAESSLGIKFSKRLIVPETRILYNPKMETSYFLIPGLIGIVICLITVLLTSMSFTKEREVGTMETILSAPIGKWEIILGKIIPSTLLALVNSTVTCIVGVLVFGMPFEGSLFLLGSVIFLFILSTVAIGIAISTISGSQQQAMMGSFLFLFPALLLSGLMFPVENMPAFMKIFAYINPIMHFNFVMRNIILKGGDLGFVTIHTGVVVLIGFLAMAIAFKNLKTTLN